MAQQPHFSGMRRAYWHSWLFNPIHSYLIDPYGYNDDAQSIETFISDHNPTNTRAAMDFPDFEDGSSDSASQDTDVSQHLPHGRVRCATD